MNYKVLLPPNIEFGIGKRQLLAEKILDFGQKVLLVTGGASFLESKNWDVISNSFENNHIKWFVLGKIRYVCVIMCVCV